jgi:hypothetical protein
LKKQDIHTARVHARAARGDPAYPVRSRVALELSNSGRRP